MPKYSKKIKRLLREYATEAYERELHRELSKLAESFTEWRDGAISSGGLSYRIHQYETGPSRELYKQYNYGSNDISVAYAIVVGILDEDEVPAELVEALSGLLDLFRSLQERGELRERS
jgi:hypothetical protein